MIANLEVNPSVMAEIEAAQVSTVQFGQIAGVVEDGARAAATVAYDQRRGRSVARQQRTLIDDDAVVAKVLP